MINLQTEITNAIKIAQLKAVFQKVPARQQIVANSANALIKRITAILYLTLKHWKKASKK